jgi:hypothetical protein
MPAWIVRVQQGWQAAGFAWQQWIVGYDASRQLSLYRWLGLGETVDSACCARLLCGVLLAGLPLLWWWRRGPESLPLQEGRARLERALQQQGITLLPSDGPLDMLNKARGCQRLPIANSSNCARNTR